MRHLSYLRALEAGDLERCHKWHNDKGLYDDFLGGYFRFVSKQTEQAWLENRTGFSGIEINLAICIMGSDEHIGNIYLREIDWVHRHAKLEIFIGECEERSKGYGQSAIRQLLYYAFNDLGLRKIYLSVLADNDAAVHVYEKCGFGVEGRLKKHEFKKGEWKDLIIMGICAEEYTAREDVGDFENGPKRDILGQVGYLPQ